MVLAQRHRGPDAQSIWTDPFVVLGCARLVVTGDQTVGAQPSHDQWGGVLVFNGEIYGMTDTEPQWAVEPGRGDGHALAAVMATRGTPGLTGLRGPFAAARYDTRTRRLTLVRDALGKKPLYVRRTQDGWAFSSTIAALRELSGPLRVRPDAEVEYLVYRSVGGNRSAFDGVEQLPPAGWLELAPDRVRGGLWWRPPDTTAGPLAAEDVAHLVTSAIEARVPRQAYGVFLSGGLDSAIVAAVATRTTNTTQPSDDVPPGRALTITYDVAGNEDESSRAARVAEHLRLPFHRVPCRAAQVPELLELAAVLLEDPIQDPVVIPTLLLAQAAASVVRVVLTGDGSDEVWGGYERYRRAPATVAGYLRRTMVFEPAELGLPEPPDSYLDQVPRPAADLPPLDRYMRLECANRLRNYHLARVDKLLMGTAVEPRTPFVDIQVVGSGLAAPAAAKVAGGVPKGLLRLAFDTALPSSVVAVAKQPFRVPIKAWLAGPLSEFAADTLGDPNARCRALVANPQRLLAGLAGGPDESARAAHQVWSLLQYEAWSRAFVTPMGRPDRGEGSHACTVA